jgi:predicted Fe-Mo cluster-binding NifX family protein
VKVAIATKGYKGLEDEVSEVLARSPTITIVEVDVDKGAYSLVEIEKNKALRFSHGSGPILVSFLADKNVELVIGPELGMSVKGLLDELGIGFMKFKPGTRVKEVLETILRGKLKAGTTEGNAS